MSRAVLLCLFALFWPLCGMAQTTSAEDRGYVQAFLEDNLSDVGREVKIIGFEGAFSSRATIQSLTIADEFGIWLTLEGVALSWNRTALLSGRLEIAELSVTSMIMSRRPGQQTGVTASGGGLALPKFPAPEARDITLPELPISVNIDKLAITKATLAPTVLGRLTRLKLSGAADLASGAGQVELTLQSLETVPGVARLKAGFSNLTRQLDLDLTIREEADGIGAYLLDLPGRPSVDLSLIGSGPLEDFSARFKLASNGAPRLEGTFSLISDTAGEQRFNATVSGDLRPLTRAEYHDFLGENLTLTLTGLRPKIGGLDLTKIEVSTAAMSLGGRITLDPSGWPSLVDLKGQIDPGDQPQILLSLPGIETLIGRTELRASFDASRGDVWQASVLVNDLTRQDFAVQRLGLRGSGRIGKATDTSTAEARGNWQFDLADLHLSNTEIDAALGENLSGRIGFVYQQGAPLTLENMSIFGADYTLTGAATILGAWQNADLNINGDVRLIAEDLARFSGLIGQPVNGSAGVRITGSAELLDGKFDVALSGTTAGLTLDIARLDPLISPPGRLEMTAKRDASGTVLERLFVSNEAAEITASATLTSGKSEGRIAARIVDTARVDPALSGPATLATTFVQNDDNWQLDLTAGGPGEVALSAVGQLATSAGTLQGFSGRLDLSAADLSPYRGLVSRPIGGALTLAAEGTFDFAAARFEGELNARSKDLRAGITDFDLLFAGNSTLAAEIQQRAAGQLEIVGLTLKTPLLTGDVSGEHSAEASDLTVALRLRDIGPFLGDLSGPASLDGRVRSTGGPWTIAADVTGPSGTRARINGSLERMAETADLSIIGTAPLGLMNRQIKPNLAFGTANFDLRLRGPMALKSLSGTLRVEGARVALSAAQLSLSDVSLAIDLANAEAQVRAKAKVSGGGQIDLSGNIGLAAPFQSNLKIDVASLSIAEPGLYQTSLSGALSVLGPLNGGAIIAGALDLGVVEIQVADSTGASTATLSGISHIREPQAVLATRKRAGLIETAGPQTGSARAFPLDITIRAPARIFVRGRGLDAEFGGALSLRGTTASVIPEGRFDLVRGRLDILGQRLALTEAYAQLQGGFDPFLYAVAETDADGTSVRIQIEGLVSALAVSITSSPDLPEDEILSRLLFGRATTQISPLQAIQIASAVRTLAGTGGDGIVERLRRNTGLDDLDISTSETGETGVRVGKYLSENIYSDVTVKSSGKSEINLNLSLNPSVTLRGKIGTDGGSGVGVYFDKDY